MTNIFMCAVALFLAFVLLFKAKIMPSTEHFFNKENSNAMRGFWCLIVVIVHTPEIYQNTIQDLIGSFAYIGVTFYFMTSAYGLKISSGKNPQGIKRFWRNRLPKLITPVFIGNIFLFFGKYIQEKEFNFYYFIRPNKWVIWLIVCYFFFWVAYRFFKISDTKKDIIICVFVVAFSATVYAFREQINTTTWCPEVFGFVWGIILSHIKDRFAEFINKGWLKKCIIFCIAAGLLGVAYLKLKPVAFYGDYILKAVLGLAIEVFILAVNTRVRLGNKVSMFLGSISYEVFLIHGICFRLITCFLPNTNAGICICVSLAFTVLMSWLLRLAVKQVNKPIIALIGKTYKDKS